ncbi:DUF397 domain-containing protein [Streptomyces luteolus]|uniref:DUF397 domain-containing protein n=1 Tax=Streptomyces luteolus TaxID=3043615 RepID=A0ABT6T8C3_9ACTN|nr:DUF397 domain-containing protein [Streptomyces sp. B-S-A12]MDI3424138.1 DUF397 domain-containing protein [Streptomyces sp. B-S-A12]
MTDRTLPDAGALDGWRKSSYSNAESGSCLEVLDGHPTIPVRDSKSPHGPALLFSPSAWTAFVNALNAEA